MQNRELEQVRAVMLAKNYPFFEKNDFNLNLIAVREDDIFDNKFSDTLHVPYKENGIWKMLTIKWTTLAGTLGYGGEQSPLTGERTGTGVSGTAVIKEGQYPKGLKYESAGTRYPFIEYLRQNNPYAYYRDNDKNGIISRNSTQQNGNFLTHWHAMSNGEDTVFVNSNGAAWSQGCMGTPAPTFFYQLMPIVRKAVKLWGAEFTPTILHKKDFL